MFKSYVNNEQFNLQINRFINDYYQEDDQYVPISRLAQIQQELINAASITPKYLLKKQVVAGHRELAFNEMKKFI
ncbi:MULTISPECIES: hypothetical protein [Paenibacillus]|jgi:hypothetical protein|uniref:Uncharacterized protein n=2 Tax=Paenibacillus TaxID=44249 RepID=A0ABX2Z8R2_PAEPO|nr:hypothetical protein ABE82_11950 [Paenibacillus peoriae]APB76076.1 hypothetical protein PPYC2_14400 [Paenibacillus polymyxa]SFR11195.1 hypothetical protein SAMN04488603_10387 [Paenibacillus sp. cl130]APQ59388.1 hypothetical protein VK72_11880 [Paenibacillus polymyxa]MDR6780873.1 hypothetical protein [Paenibacillus peoriae]